MDKIISILKTPEECLQAAELFTGLANQARRRAVELKALSHGSKSEIETELYKALYAYEEILSIRNNRRTSASRTWQMVNRYGIIETAERAVNRPTEAMGYQVLAEKGMSDLTFESIIVHHPEAFSREAVERAKARLEEYKK